MKGAVRGVLNAVLCAFSVAYGQNNAQVVLPDTETFELSSTHTGKNYQIYVALPAGYWENSTAYPLLLCLDANAGFGLVTQIYRYLRFGNEVPELLIVGIGYARQAGTEIVALRAADFTPTVSTRSSSGQGSSGSSGGAPRFLRFIQDELLPLIDRNYRVLEDRTLAGHSHGGLFATYALFHSDSTFKRYIIGSPSLWYDDKVSFGLEENFARTHKDLPASVYWCYGSAEGTPELPMGPLVQQMVKRLESRKYSEFKSRLEVLHGDTHLSSVPVTYSSGLRYVFQLDQPRVNRE